MTPSRSRFVGNTLSLAVSTVLSTVLTLAQMKILAASLPMAVFGLFASLRGLSLLLSILAANGFPQALVRFLPEHAARGERRVAVRASVIAVAATLAACTLMLSGVIALRARFLAEVPPAQMGASLLLWFSVTTLAVALKLVLYGGFNGLRRFGSQTVLETLTLAAQALWMWLGRDALDLGRLFEIVGVTSAVSALIAIPWFALRLANDVRRGQTAPPAGGSYARYWVGAVGLSVVALAFTDVDRWVLSHVLALEVLSLFHVASRIVRLANRFIAVPVLTLQPEITRIRAEGREDVGVVTSAFFKASVMMGVFAAAAIAAYAGPLIELASGRAFLGARTTLLLLAAAIPLTAMTAPLTAVMKALDGVRAAFYCDLAWACVYITLMVALASSLGLEGTGWAAIGASLVQLVVAMRLASVRPAVSVAVATLLRAVACGVIAFIPVWLLERSGAGAGSRAALAPVAAVIFVLVARRLRLLEDEERRRVRSILATRGMGALVNWFVP
jgi:O-antigen/teichoic acid export membrane protein